MKLTDNVVHYEKLLSERITSTSATVKKGFPEIVPLRLSGIASGPVAITMTGK